jgi:hypothetical protein
MRRALGQALRIGVSAQAVSLLRTSRWHGEPVTVLAEHAFAPSADHLFDSIAQALRALLGELELGGWPVSFVLADDLVRLWQVTPPAGATRMADLEAAAALRFHALYGDAPSAWQISADWDAQKPFFAAAMPRALLAELALVAQEYKLSVVGIAPHFVTAWNRWCRAIQPGAWFGLVHEQVLTLAVIDAAHQGAAHGVRAVRAVPVPAGADHQWLAQTLQRESLLQNVPAPALLQVCGSAPASWLRAASGVAAVGANDGSGAGGAAAPQLTCVALDQSERAVPQGASPVVLLARGGVAA